MEKRKVDSKSRYLYAFLIGTAIFILGFAITYSVAYAEYQRVSTLNDDVSYGIFQEKLQFSLFDQDICKGDSYQRASDALAFQGSILADLEEKMGKNNENILTRKKFYSLVLAEHLELINTINQECNESFNTILFFYSNEKEDAEKSKYVGGILDVLYQQNKGDLFIYSFDMNLDSDIIGAFKEKYSVEAPMKLVINERYTTNSVNNIAQLQSILN
jgi:hypothetical protein